MRYKGVFFDWFNTLVGYDTPREILYKKAFKQNGQEISIRTILKGIQRGDRHYFSKVSPLNKTSNSLEEQAQYYQLYPQFIADEAHLQLAPEILLDIIRKVLAEFNNNMVMYPDCVRAIESLKRNKILVGVITNADSRAVQMVKDSPVGKMVDWVTTSEEAQSEKPDPGIFRLALKKSDLQAKDAVFVGDQYVNDVMGAKSAGLKAILIDRWDALEDDPDFTRIKSMDDLLSCLQ
jgi:putative hydrolase of the HAD superfamily